MKLQCNKAFHKYGVPGLEAWALRHAGIFHLSVTNFLRKCQCHSTLPAPPWHPLQQPVQSRCSMNFLVSLWHKTHDTSCLGFTRVTITSSGQSKVSKLPRAFRDMPGKNKKSQSEESLWEQGLRAAKWPRNLILYAPPLLAYRAYITPFNVLDKTIVWPANPTDDTCHFLPQTLRSFGTNNIT